MSVMLKTVLCVDDDPGVLAALERVLRSYRVVLSRHGLEAIQWCKNNRPDLILLDLTMPRMNGFAFMRAFHAMGFNTIPIVVLTADLCENTMMEAYGSGGCYFINKPFRNQRVLDIVDYLIGDLSEEERLCLEQKL